MDDEVELADPQEGDNVKIEIDKGSESSDSQKGKKVKEQTGSKDFSQRGLGGTMMYMSPEIKAITRIVGDGRN